MLRLCLLVTMGAAVLAAQSRSQLSGFVRDGSQAVVQDAAITVLNLDNGIRRSTHSNQEGFYAVSSLTPGQYKITVRKPGFNTVARTGVMLHAMDAGRLDFSLDIGSVREEIFVESAPPLLNTSDASYGMQMTRHSAEQLPVNGRGLQGLIDLAPGVLTTPATAGEAGQFSANGQRPATNYFTVDGVSANNGISGSGLPGQFSGGALPSMTAIGSLHNLVSLGELDELRVQTSTFSPEYGRLPGAQVAVSTRSGSNSFHGELFGSMRHERASGRDWFANAAGLAETPRRLQDVGGTLSGPLLRNRTFFLVTTEQLRLRQTNASLIPVPSLTSRETAAGTVRGLVRAFPVPNGPGIGGGLALHTAVAVNPADVGTSSVRLDQGVGNRGSLFLRYNRTPSSNRFGYLQQNEADFRSQTITVGAVSVLSPRVTNDARIGSSRVTVDSKWLPGAADIDLRAVLPVPGNGQRLYGIGIQGLGQLLTGDAGSSRQNQWNLADTVAFTTGRHDLRFGADYQRLSPERRQPIHSVVAVYDSFDRLIQGTIPSYVFAQTGSGKSLLETLSLFAQDTWHASSRLNLTWGARWELTPAPAYQQPVPGSSINFGPPGLLPPLPPRPPPGSSEAKESPVWKTRYGQFAPRLGAAFRVSDRTVIRSGAGLFYDLGFASAVDLVNGSPYNRWRSTAGIASILSDGIQYGFAPNLRLPYSLQWNVAAEHGFGADSAASVAWVGSAGRGLLRREGRTPQAPGQPLVVLATNNGESDYQSLQLHYRSRNVNGLQGIVSYTWAHAIDNGSWDSAAYRLLPGATSAADRGPANFDVRHSFQAALAYDLGRTRLRWSRGWMVSGTLRARTGFPVDVVSVEQPFGLGFDNEFRPDLVPGQPVWLTDPGAPGGRRLNPAAFSVPVNRQGTLGRNALRGNGLAQVDLALQREFAITETTSIQFRAEGYNVANSPSFADPVRVLSSPLFGLSPSLTSLMLGAGRPNSGLSSAFQSGGPRVLQAGVTIRF